MLAVVKFYHEGQNSCGRKLRIMVCFDIMSCYNKEHLQWVIKLMSPVHTLNANNKFLTIIKIKMNFFKCGPKYWF